LAGAVPSMENRNCEIKVNNTKITRIEIKTMPLKKWFDPLLVAIHIILGYIDLVLDILAIIALSSSDIAIMAANIIFICLSVFLNVWIAWPDTVSMILTILLIDPLYQGFKTIAEKHQTPRMIVSKKLDAITRSIPSMILQLYGLLKSLSQSKSSRILLLLFSIVSSIVGAAFTLSSLSPKSGNSFYNKSFFKHFIYFITELTLRVVVLAIIFIVIGAYGYLVLVLDFSIRLLVCLSLVIGQSKNKIRDASLLAIQSFGSDYTVPGKDNQLLDIAFKISSVEAIIFLIALNKLHVQEKNDNVILTVVVCVTWFIKAIFIYSKILDLNINDAPWKGVDNNERELDAISIRIDEETSSNNINT
jgi:hypothetical protein